MKRRDAYILSGIGIIAAIAGFWMVLVAPKRAELSKVNAVVSTNEQALAAARAEAQQFAQARHEFPRAYASVVRLGKAVPADLDMPSPVVQLEDTGRRAGVDFRKLALASASASGASAGPGGAAPTPTPAPAAPPATGAPATASPPATGATGATGPTGAAAPGSAPAAAPGAPAPANAVTVATLPIGATVGEAGLPTLKLNLVFQGSFFRMAKLLTHIQRLVQKHGDGLRVSGRLVTVDGFSLAKGDGGFPQVRANVAATAYLVPEAQGLLAGATASGPPAGTPGTPTPAASQPGGLTTPPSAVVAP